MAQTKLQKTVAAAALGGLMLGASAYIAGCTHHDSDGTSAGTKVSSNDVAKHDCKGKNACKGQGGCKTADHACKGLNSCKGQGGCKTN